MPEKYEITVFKSKFVQPVVNEIRNFGVQTVDVLDGRRIHFACDEISGTELLRLETRLSTKFDGKISEVSGVNEVTPYGGPDMVLPGTLVTFDDAPMLGDIMNLKYDTSTRH